MATTILALACGGGGGGGGTEPPGPPDHLVRGGDGQSWYFNNPLPSPYSVTVFDLHNRAVPGVSVDWSITTGGGTLSANPSTTNANGVAFTTHTLGSATTYVVNATVTGLPPVAFGATASAPPTTAAVSIADNSFSPASVVIQSGGTVTWTWGGIAAHNVTYTGGPTPRPANSGNMMGSGTFSSTITTVGKYDYVCTNHPGMSGTVTVVN